VNHEINNVNDLFEMLDAKTRLAEFDWMYSGRPARAPFIVQNELPDENLVEFIRSAAYPTPQSALELGCGEGRNAVFMAGENIRVTAVDLSRIAIDNAKKLAAKRGVSVDFIADNIFNAPPGTYQFVYDSGCLHHLAPHRRLSYLDLLDRSLTPGGYFGLSCFAWGENCADEVDDREFYNSEFRAGVAFTEERLRSLFGEKFEAVYIRKYKNGVSGTIQGLEFMWVCLFRKK